MSRVNPRATCPVCMGKGWNRGADGFGYVCASCQPDAHVQASREAAEALNRAAAKASSRRFTGARLTGFGGL